MADDSDTVFSALATERYLSLETYRRNGEGVRTPVWFAADPDAAVAVVYVYTGANSGKVKRLRRSDRARVAACDMRGLVTGTWVDVQGVIAGGAEAEHGMRLLNRKYWPWKQLLDLSARFRPGHQRAVIAIRVRQPAAPGW
ncbi:MAG TPA: PPOX class F420-dependent oxidoreductase [Rhodopila sp.]|nr:PPOX class F420-dependent oxidoreductase [Rhodopila sp.]